MKGIKEERKFEEFAPQCSPRKQKIISSRNSSFVQTKCLPYKVIRNVVCLRLQTFPVSRRESICKLFYANTVDTRIPGETLGAVTE